MKYMLLYVFFTNNSPAISVQQLAEFSNRNACISAGYLMRNRIAQMNPNVPTAFACINRETGQEN